MNFVMTVIIAINHFLVAYATGGSQKHIIFSRIAVLFKFLVYILLVAANSRLTISRFLQWNNSLQYLTDRALLLLLIGIQTQFNSFNVMRQDLLKAKREGRRN